MKTITSVYQTTTIMRICSQITFRTYLKTSTECTLMPACARPGLVANVGPAPSACPRAATKRWQRRRWRRFAVWSARREDDRPPDELALHLSSTARQLIQVGMEARKETIRLSRGQQRAILTRIISSHARAGTILNIRKQRTFQLVIKIWITIPCNKKTQTMIT